MPDYFVMGPFLSSAVALVGWIILTFIAGAVGGSAASDARGFYARLVKPSWAPPGWLFAPVWTTLYVLMAVAAWLVWRERGSSAVRGALVLFVVQLICNSLWSWLFFAWRRGALAFADVLVLAVLIAATIVAFASVRALAAALLVPYLGWVLFASVLTATLWHRNPQLL